MKARNLVQVQKDDKEKGEEKNSSGTYDAFLKTPANPFTRQRSKCAVSPQHPRAASGGAARAHSPSHRRR